MSLLATFVGNPWAGAMGWTLLHSLWQGAIVSAVLAVVLLSSRSPRVRYGAACLGLLVMLMAFSLTLFELAPMGPRGPVRLNAPSVPTWKVPALAERGSLWELSLATVAPWLAPFWMAGVLIFCGRYTVGFFSLERFRRRGVCSAPDSWQRRLESLGSQLRVARPVLLLNPVMADAPMVIGHLRPLKMATGCRPVTGRAS